MQVSTMPDKHKNMINGKPLLINETCAQYLDVLSNSSGASKEDTIQTFEVRMNVIRDVLVVLKISNDVHTTLCRIWLAVQHSVKSVAF